MRRGLMPGVRPPRSVAAQLPGVYQGELVVEAFCAALDEVLAPVVLTLDSLPAYLDPRTTPRDMLPWLAGWLGIAVDNASSTPEQRSFVRAGADVLRWRGTAKGLRDALRLEAGLDADIDETGGTEWSSTPGADLPGTAGNSVIVRISAEDPDLVDAGLVEEIVAAGVPAHMEYRIEVVTPNAAG